MAQVYKATAWWQYTMIRITLALVLGLLMGRYIPIPQWCLWLCFIPVFLVWLFIDQRNTQSLFHMRWISGGAIQVIFILIGYVLLYRQPIPRIQSTITLIERPIQKANHYEAKAMMGETILLIYFQANHQIKDLTIGARLRLYKQPSAILNNSNPGGFNYQAYAASQNIYHQVYLKATDFALVSISNPPIFQSYLTQTSAYVLRVVTQYIHQPRERSIAEALLIGYKKIWIKY